MEPGLFVTFFDKDEARERELPPVGPLDHVVLRPGPRLIAARSRVHQTDPANVPIARWLEAELELIRATGEEPGGMRRRQMRFTSRDGLFIRFVSYGDAHEQGPLPELGPFSEIVIRPLEIEANGTTIATLAVADFATWALNSNAGDHVAGAFKPDVALRAADEKYHPSLPPAPPPGTVAAPARRAMPPPRPPVVAPVPRAKQQALAAHDVGLVERLERERAEESLRARVFEENRPGRGDAGEPGVWAPHREPSASRTSRTTPRATKPAAVAEDRFSVGEALWRWRFAIIGVLIVAVATYAAYAAIRAAAPSGPQLTTVNLGQHFSGTRWEWTINSVQRNAASGNARARGTFYSVNLAATNRGGEGAEVTPEDFTLTDANGETHRAETLASGVYQVPTNPSSPNQWPQSFPVGRAVTFTVVFDVDASLARGNQLAIGDAPNVRVRLD